jgi:hypothetical protein
MMGLLFDLPSWVTGFNFLIALFTFLTLIGAAIVVLLVKGRGEIATLQVDRAVAAEALVKTRDAEIVTLVKRIAELEDELEGLTAEHRTIVGISIAKLMEYWAIKESKEAELADAHSQIRILKMRKDGIVT